MRYKPPPGRDPVCVLVGRNVREVRSARGMTQKALGTLVEMGQASISALELGDRCPSVQGLYRLAKALGVDAGVLLAESAGDGSAHVVADERPGRNGAAPRERLVGVAIMGQPARSGFDEVHLVRRNGDGNG